MARATGLPKSTVSRTLVALEEQGAVDRLDEQGHYVIGAGLSELTEHASPVRLMRDLARPELVGLAETLGEACALAVADGAEVLFLECFEAEGVVQVQDWTGVRFAPHVVAAGLALLSTWETADVAAYASGGLDRATERTIGSATALRTRLAKVAEAGVAWTFGEFSDEINGLGAPVRFGGGPAVGAVTVYGPEYRFPASARERRRAERAVAAAADRISSGLTAH